MKNRFNSDTVRAVKTVLVTLIVCGGVLLASTTVFGQEKQSFTKTEPSDKYGAGGKEVTTETKSEDGDVQIETKDLDAKGKLREQKTETTDDSGKTTVIEKYDESGKLIKRSRVKRNSCGKMVTVQNEDYQDGVLLEGEIVEFGENGWIPTGYKEWDPAKQQYEDRAIDDWMKHAFPEGNPFNRNSSLTPNVCTRAVDNTHLGLASATFRTEHGRITVNVPDDLAPGDTFSGTVITDPAGASETERARNQNELNGYVVEVGEQRIPASQRLFTRALKTLKSTLPLIIRDRTEREDGRLFVPIRSRNRSTEPPSSPATSDFHLPEIGQAGRPIQVRGPCDGDFANTLVRIGGANAPLLAESPRSVVAQSPRDIVGPTTIEFSERGVGARGNFRNVAVNLSAAKTALLKGEHTTLLITVRGLQGIQRDVPLRLTNGSPEIISMAAGTAQTINIHPGDVRAEGVFTTERELTGIRKGGFTITATLMGNDDGIGPGKPTLAKEKVIEEWHKAYKARKAAEEAKKLAEQAAADAKAAAEAAKAAQDNADQAKKKNAPDEKASQTEANKKKAEADKKQANAREKQNDADAKGETAEATQKALKTAESNVTKPGQLAKTYLDEAGKLSAEAASAQTEADRAKEQIKKNGDPNGTLQKHADKMQQEANDKKQEADELKKNAATIEGKGGPNE